MEGPFYQSSCGPVVDRLNDSIGDVDALLHISAYRSVLQIRQTQETEMARVSIEDCLNVMENRFALVSVAASRTRQLMAGEAPLLITSNKLVVTALREIADGLITAQLPVEVEKSDDNIAQ